MLPVGHLKTRTERTNETRRKRMSDRPFVGESDGVNGRLTYVRLSIENESLRAPIHVTLPLTAHGSLPSVVPSSVHSPCDVRNVR